MEHKTNTDGKGIKFTPYKDLTTASKITIAK